MIDLDKEGFNGNAGGRVLDPIPSNFIDIARQKVLTQKKMEDAREQQLNSMENNIIQQSPQQTNTNPKVVEQTQSIQTTNNKDNSSIRYFKDSRGNEFKIENGILYSKEWSKSKLKFRIINEKTGNVMNLDGKILQIFGWARVDDINHDEVSDDDINVDDITEETVNV